MPKTTLFSTGILLILFFPFSAQGQEAANTYRELTDSCFHYLETGDSIRFNRIYVQLPAAYEKAADPEMAALREELLTMRERDQGIRLLLLSAWEKYGQDSEPAGKIHSRMKTIDRENGLRVERIVERYGWPGKDEIGEEANETLFLCVQHADGTKLQQRYLPLLEEAVRQGRAEPWHYAFLTDRIRMNRGEKQIYGTQSIRGKEPYLVPLEDPDRVDSLRKDIGLEPLEDYASSLGIPWNPGQYKEKEAYYLALYQKWYAARKAE